MAFVQKQFEKFHEAIKLNNLDENASLREKSDIILNKIRSGLKKKREEDSTVPTFVDFNQGSYAMGTGIKPLEGIDYDIDVGLVFNITRADYEDPTKLKELVYETVSGHTTEDSVKDPCLRVQYKSGGADRFHVDLAIYAKEGEALFLARGKLHALPENRRWEESDPKGFIKQLKEHFAATEEQQQLRRIIRCMKRWKDHRFSSEGHAAPTGIALTVAACKFLQPSFSPSASGGAGTPDDLKCLTLLVDSMISCFQSQANGSKKIVLNITVPPHNDLFEKMSAPQMNELFSKLEKLRAVLLDVDTEVDPHDACKLLRKEFGEDFPVPDKDETARRVTPAISSHGQSA